MVSAEFIFPRLSSRGRPVPHPLMKIKHLDAHAWHCARALWNIYNLKKFNRDSAGKLEKKLEYPRSVQSVLNVVQGPHREGLREEKNVKKNNIRH